MSPISTCSTEPHARGFGIGSEIEVGGDLRAHAREKPVEGDVADRPAVRGVTGEKDQRERDRAPACSGPHSQPIVSNRE